MESSMDTGENVAEAAASVADGMSQPQAESQPEMVPVTALQAERRERQQLQDKFKMLEDHVVLMGANQQQQQAAPKSEFDGLSDDDVLTVGEFKKALSAKEQQYQMGIQELRISQKHQDYEEVVNKYLPDVIKKNPALKGTLSSDPNRYELAYYLAKNSDEYRNAIHEGKKSEDAKRLVENSQRAGSLSAVGSTAPQGQVGNFKAMSDSDFMKMANKNRGCF